ncbi:MAG: DUF4139 domain-containing protein [Chryseolinea sp.]
MKTTLLLPALFIVFTSFGQNLKEKELKTDLKEVTVFLDGAQLFEIGSVSIPTEKSLLRIKGLSPFIDEKSIQVKADGDFTILSVNHKLNYLDVVKKDHAIDSLKKISEVLESKIEQENARLSVLHEKQSLLDENKKLGGQNAGATIVQLKQAMDFYEAELSRIKEEEIRIRKSIALKKDDQAQLSKQLKEEHDRKILPTGEIEIRVRADKATQGKFSVTYLVSNAGWFPKYDIRVKNINSPLELTYKAEVFQNTGVEWKNVKLRFSNGTPNQSGLAPEIKPWLLNYARYTITDKYSFMGSSNTGSVRGKVVDENGEAIPGVNIVVKGSTIGTVTDAYGSYSLTLPGPNSTLVFSFVGYSSQEFAATNPNMNVTLASDVTALQEVVVAGYTSGRVAGVTSGSNIRIRGISSYSEKAQPLITTFIENQTTVEIEVKEPYSIKSDGQKLMVDLNQYDIPADYEYYAVPKIDKDAFLMARIVQWDQYNLLEGEANLYFEDAYIGRSILNAKALTDTLSISLGRDKNIVIARTKADQFNRRRAIGSNQTETRGFKIVVKNKKSQPIKLTLFDQLPVAVNSDINVNPLELSGALLDSKTGKLTWQQILDPQQQKELVLQYEVKYPKKESVVLE